MKQVYPYSAERAGEFAANREPITEKQIRYINRLSRDNNDRDRTLNDIMDSIDSKLDIEDLTKGQAMFVIKCLLGEIQPLSKPAP